MTGFSVVILWSDALIWLLVAAGLALGLLIAKNPPLLSLFTETGELTLDVALPRRRMTQ